MESQLHTLVSDRVQGLWLVTLCAVGDLLDLSQHVLFIQSLNSRHLFQCFPGHLKRGWAHRYPAYSPRWLLDRPIFELLAHLFPWYRGPVPSLISCFLLICSSDKIIEIANFTSYLFDQSFRVLFPIQFWSPLILWSTWDIPPSLPLFLPSPQRLEYLFISVFARVDVLDTLVNKILTRCEKAMRFHDRCMFNLFIIFSNHFQ